MQAQRRVGHRGPEAPKRTNDRGPEGVASGKPPTGKFRGEKLRSWPGPRPRPPRTPGTSTRWATENLLHYQHADRISRSHRSLTLKCLSES